MKGKNANSLSKENGRNNFAKMKWDNLDFFFNFEVISLHVAAAFENTPCEVYFYIFICLARTRIHSKRGSVCTRISFLPMKSYWEF